MQLHGINIHLSQHVGGAAVIPIIAGEEIIYQDTFTEVSDTDMGSHTADTGQTYSGATVNNAKVYGGSGYCANKGLSDMNSAVCEIGEDSDLGTLTLVNNGRIASTSGTVLTEWEIVSAAASTGLRIDNKETAVSVGKMIAGSASAFLNVNLAVGDYPSSERLITVTCDGSGVTLDIECPDTTNTYSTSGAYPVGISSTTNINRLKLTCNDSNNGDARFGELSVTRS
jgi:hypothetical protein